MATHNEEEGGSRLWRGMRALLFGEDPDATLRDQIEDAIDEADAEPQKRGDLSPIERQMLRNLLHFGDRTVGEVAVTRGDIVSVPSTISFDDLIAAFADAEHSRLPVTGEGAHFARLHVCGAVVVHMIIAEQVERTVHHQVSGMLVDRNAFLFGFRDANAAGQDDVAEHQLGARRSSRLELVTLGHRKGQDIGRLVLAAPFGVQRMDFLVAGEADRQFHVALALTQVGKGAFGDGGGCGGPGQSGPVPATVPLRIGVDGDIQRHGFAGPS